MNEMKQGALDAVDQDAAQARKSWAAFVERDVADFFTGNKLEKMTIEDGNGNKAKLGRAKDGGIKIEYTSTVMI
ncbi:hypothetical protein [Agathobaculum desmolans]|uniref:hypothetical protein n=1 Tax=Agathobaculum desmolans TaxID=39484 RepID=UPI0004E11311|nr:hypothetical protein [Agathobaculum desmolans]